MSAPIHAVFGRPLDEPVPHGFDQVIFGMGRFWGAERLFWEQEGVHMTSVGFAGGTTENPTYEQVSAGDTGHAEVVRVVFDSSRISFEHLLKLFWDNHDPTQGDRQGDDVGSQYRSVIMTFNDTQQALAEASKVDYGNRLAVDGFGDITTQILPATTFWPAEESQQQYLAKNADGRSDLRGTGVESAMIQPSGEL
ncbi:peptide-methionine (S)-S-oxide reductase MsrA [Paracoccus pacificus]|uniref:Peptide methionine sulfoxide reductase MsrA n=1 Tax=Paracoccus pacificus TaxID=1463598 RepID=A0ABW4R9B2_9RHOB